MAGPMFRSFRFKSRNAGLEIFCAHILGFAPHDTKALIVWIRRALRDFTGAQLYVASSSSSLAKDLTLYPWEDLEN